MPISSISVSSSPFRPSLYYLWLNISFNWLLFECYPTLSTNSENLVICIVMLIKLNLTTMTIKCWYVHYLELHVAHIYFRNYLNQKSLKIILEKFIWFLVGAVCTKQCSKCTSPFTPHCTPRRRILPHSIYKACKPRRRDRVTRPRRTAGPVAEPDFSPVVDFRACAHNHGAIVPLWVCLQTQSKGSFMYTEIASSTTTPFQLALRLSSLPSSYTFPWVRCNIWEFWGTNPAVNIWGGSWGSSQILESRLGVLEQ